MRPSSAERAIDVISAHVTSVPLATMVTYCCAFGCQSKYKKGGSVTFHSFPKEESRRKLWEWNLHRKNFKATIHSKVCSKHFSEECFDREKLGGTWLRQDAVPTKFNFPSHFVPKMKMCKPQKPRAVFTPNHVESVDDCKNDHGSSSSSTQCEILVRTPVTPDASTPIRKTKKRYHYVGDFTEDDMHIPSKARKVLRIAKRHTESNRKKIRFLRQEKNRLEKRVASLKIILNELKKKPLLSDSDDNISQITLPGSEAELIKQTNSNAGGPLVLQLQNHNVNPISIAQIGMIGNSGAFLCMDYARNVVHDHTYTDLSDTNKASPYDTSPSSSVVQGKSISPIQCEQWIVTLTSLPSYDCKLLTVD